MTIQNYESKKCCFKNLSEKRGSVKNGKVKNVRAEIVAVNYWGSRKCVTKKYEIEKCETKLC